VNQLRRLRIHNHRRLIHSIAAVATRLLAIKWPLMAANIFTLVSRAAPLNTHFHDQLT
jgi:hypothetical protein